MRRIIIEQKKLHFNNEDVESMFEGTATAFADGAKIGCPKKYIGRKVYVLVRKT